MCHYYGKSVIGLINISQPHDFISYQSTSNIYAYYDLLYTVYCSNFTCTHSPIFSVHTIAKDMLPISVGMHVK